MNNEPNNPGNYLSIDEGPSGLPALYTLEETFNRLQDDLKSDEELVPRRWFNIIIGTGRGAIIALLLGKLGLTVSKAIDAYMKLEPVLSVKQAQDDNERERNTKEFKKLFLEILSEADVKEDAPMLDDTETKTVICVANMVNVSVVHLIRSYPVRGTRAAPCTILDAACACVAFPDQFLPVVIGSGHRKMTLVDAVAGYANPTKELLKEAQKIFGDNAEVAAIFSIGPGRWSVKITTEQGPGVQLAEALKRGVIGSEQVHQDLQDRLLKTGIYYRFNVEQELSNESDIILAYISAYLGEGVTSSRLDEGIRQIQNHPLGTRLKDINSVTVVEIKLKPRPRLVPHFIGRDDILDAMRHSHFNGHQTQQQSPAITILSGIGGLGKTQTALKFALEFEEIYPDDPVYFLDASAPEKLQTDLETLIRSRGSAYQSKSYEDALVWLATELKNWLMILDNADDPNMDPVRYIPQCAHGHIIITTRNSTLAALAPNNSHALDGLSVPDAITLLLTASNYPNEEVNRSLAEKIVLELGCLPLALAHAAGYIFVHRCLTGYLDIYRRNRERILSSTNPRLLDDYRLSVTMTIALSFEKLSEGARDVIRLFAYLQATSVPHSMIIKAVGREFRRVESTEVSSLNPQTLAQADVLGRIFCPSGEWSEFDFNEHIQECLQYSLLRLATQNDDKFYSMHVLVQSHLQEAGLIHDHEPKRLICRLLGSAVTIGSDYEFLGFNRLLLPHLRSIQIEYVIEAGDHYGIGYVLQEVGDVQLALLHREKCMEIWRVLLGEEDSKTIMAMQNVAESYFQLGRNEAAIQLLREILSLRTRLLGPEHLDTVRTMGNLASSYARIGDYRAALELEQRVLPLRRTRLGSDHPETMRSMSNLAVFYKNLGRRQDALELEEEVLLLRRSQLGPEHPHTILTMGNLATSYKYLGNSQAAVELEKEVLSLQRRLLGPEHPDTVRTMGNLAVSYANVGNTQAALELEEEVLSIRIRVLGRYNGTTLDAMWNLLITYDQLGMHDRRLELLRTAIPLYEASEAYGPNHPDTLKLRDYLNELSARLASAADN